MGWVCIIIYLPMQLTTVLRSIGSVIAGFLVVALLSIATDALLESLRIFPMQTNPRAFMTWMLAIALFYRSIYTMVGGYVTARFAPLGASRHIIVLMVLGGIAGVLGAINGWGLGNHWYPIALAVTGPMFIWIGGKLQTR